MIADVLRHLNVAYSCPVCGSTVYVWPSAMTELTSPYGDGLPADEYAAILEVYTVEDLEVMCEGIGGYVGWRLSIDADGEWLLFLAGD